MLLLTGSQILLNDLEVLWIIAASKGRPAQSESEQRFRSAFASHASGAQERIHLAQIAEQRQAQQQAGITVSEAAKILGVQPAAVRKRLRQGSLSGWKDNGRWRLDERELRSQPHL